MDPPPYSANPPFGANAFPGQIPPPPPGYYQGGNNFQQDMGPPPPLIAGDPAVLQNYAGIGPAQVKTKHPTRVMCPHCNQVVVSQPEAKIGGAAWLLCIFIALIGFPCGCCLIPFCVQDCKNFHHKCPNCLKTIYVYSPL